MYKKHTQHNNTSKQKHVPGCPHCGFAILQAVLEEKVLQVLESSSKEHVNVAPNGYTRLEAGKKTITTELGEKAVVSVPLYFEHIDQRDPRHEKVCDFRIDLNMVLKKMGLHKDPAFAYAR